MCFSILLFSSYNFPTPLHLFFCIFYIVLHSTLLSSYLTSYSTISFFLPSYMFPYPAVAFSSSSFSSTSFSFSSLIFSSLFQLLPILLLHSSFLAMCFHIPILLILLYIVPVLFFARFSSIDTLSSLFLPMNFPISLPLPSFSSTSLPFLFFCRILFPSARLPSLAFKTEASRRVSGVRVLGAPASQQLLFASRASGER